MDSSSPHYFPSIDFFSAIKNLSSFYFNLNIAYNKKLQTNRCVVLDAKGKMFLSVPLLGGRNQKNSFKEIKIFNHDDWQAHHWKTIISCYNRSPFFFHYKNSLEKVFFQKYEFLYELNLKLLDWALVQLKHNMSIYILEYDVINEISIKKKQMPYIQTFQDKYPFVPNCSVLDLLFNTGPDAYRYY